MKVPYSPTLQISMINKDGQDLVTPYIYIWNEWRDRRFLLESSYNFHHDVHDGLRD